MLLQLPRDLPLISGSKTGREANTCNNTEHKKCYLPYFSPISFSAKAIRPLMASLFIP